MNVNEKYHMWVWRECVDAARLVGAFWVVPIKMASSLRARSARSHVP